MTTLLNKEVQALLQTPAFNKHRRKKLVSLRRNAGNEDWFVSYMNSMVKEKATADHTINAKTGETHTVSSLVEELKDRVNLSYVLKNASIKQSAFPLSAKAMNSKEMSDEKKVNVFSYIKSILDAHHGYCDSPAIIFNLKEKFGEELISSNFEFVESSVKDIKKQFAKPETTINVREESQPMKLDEQNDSLQPLFEHIENL